MKRGIVGAIILSLFLVGEAWPQAGRRHLTNPDAHHPQAHAGAHSEDGVDEVKVEDLASDCSGPIEGDATGGTQCGSYPSSPDAEFVVGAAHAGLTSEWVLGDDVLFRSANCTAETGKAIGAVCFQSDNTGAWRHEGSDSWIKVAAPPPGSVVGAGQSPLSATYALGTDVILVSADCTTVTNKPTGAVCLNTALTRLWRHTGSNTWAEVVLNVQADWDETTTTDPSFIQNKPTIMGATNLGIDSRTGTTLDITSSTGTDATVPGATTTQAGLISSANNVKLGDITRGSNPANLANQNYAWEVSARSVNSGVSPSLRVGRNTHASNQRAGFVELESRDGSDNRLWFNNDGKLCKSDSGDPDATDSNCEAVGVDPQIITMAFGSPNAGYLMPRSTTTYIPLGTISMFHGSSTWLVDLNSVGGIGSSNNSEGIPFPAGQIDSFGFFARAGASTGACDVTVTVVDDTSATSLTGTVNNIGRAGDTYSDADTATIGAGSIMSVLIATSADCANSAGGGLKAVIISMNFIPA